MAGDDVRYTHNHALLVNPDKRTHIIVHYILHVSIITLSIAQPTNQLFTIIERYRQENVTFVYSRNVKIGLKKC